MRRYADAAGGGRDLILIEEANILEQVRAGEPEGAGRRTRHARGGHRRIVDALPQTTTARPGPSAALPALGHEGRLANRSDKPKYSLTVYWRALEESVSAWPTPRCT